MTKRTIIAFIGNDGTGKSTQVKKLLSFLKKKKYSAKMIHLDHFFLKVPEILGKNKYFSNKDEVNQSIKLFKHFAGNKIFRLVFPIIIYIDFLFFKIILSKTKVIILDRYFYDKIIKYMDLNVFASFLSDIFFRITLRPSYTFYLDVDSRISLERKGEMNISILNRRRKLYERFNAKYHFTKINANEEQETVFSSVLNKLKLEKFN